MHQLSLGRETLEETLTCSQVADLRLAASNLVGAERRACQAAMVLNSGDGRSPCPTRPHLQNQSRLYPFNRGRGAQALGEMGFSAQPLPHPSTMAGVLNRMGYRLRKVVKAKPQKKAETDEIFANIQTKDQPVIAMNAKRLSLDCKATVS